jgi:glycosyltransferase involved in cell wall biosynthesis
VYPPVDTVFYHPASVEPEPHFLIVSALVPYKRIDLAVAACQRIGAPLRIIGDGPELARLTRQAGPDTTLLGWRSDEEIRDEYRRAAAVILPGEEDFGIVPLEAQACGRPVVALARGGALETVKDGETGLLFEEPTIDSLAMALQAVRGRAFDPALARAQAERFSQERYVRQMQALIDDTMAAPAGTTW